MVIESLTAVILAGGKGTRLKSVVADKPKPLAEVAGRPFIEYILDELNRAGVKRVVIAVGYLAEHVQHYLGDSYKNLNLIYSYESSPLGTAGALRNALPLIESKDVLVLNGDSFCEVNYKYLLESHKKNKAMITIVGVTVENVQRYGTIVTAADGLVTAFQEKGGLSGEGQINAGIYMIDYSVLTDIKPDSIVSLEHEIVPQYTGETLYAFPVSGTFIDIGIPEDYEYAQQLFSHNCGGRENH